MKTLRLSAIAIVWVCISAEATFAGPPFQNVNPPQTTTPYLQLYQQNPRNPQYQNAYQTIVRPRLQQVQQFQEQQLKIDKLEIQQELARTRHLPPPSLGPPPRGLGASKNIRSTGHQTRFLDGRRFQEQTHYFPSRIPR